MKRFSNIVFLLFTLLTGALISYSLYLTFMVVPDEKIMGAVQRIFYFHVGSAFATYLALGVVLIGALGYLATERSSFDAIQESAGEVSLLFASIVLFSGMIWGYSAWGTAFRFEPRLVTSLILWLILIGLNILRLFGDSSRLPTHCAVLGILSVLTVPVVIYSIKLLPQFQQLHPQVVEKGGLVDPLMKQAFYTTSLALMVLTLLLIWARYRLGLLERRQRNEELV